MILKKEKFLNREIQCKKIYYKKNDNIISIFTQSDLHYNAGTVETVTVWGVNSRLIITIKIFSF